MRAASEEAQKSLRTLLDEFRQKLAEPR
jgi:hypothetical protein